MFALSCAYGLIHRFGREYSLATEYSHDVVTTQQESNTRALITDYGDSCLEAVILTQAFKLSFAGATAATVSLSQYYPRLG
jgi:hypothetical protein